MKSKRQEGVLRSAQGSMCHLPPTQALGWARTGQLCMHAKSLQSCPLWDPMDCSPPGSSVYGILQARILEWVAMSPALVERFFTTLAPPGKRFCLSGSKTNEAFSLEDHGETLQKKSSFLVGVCSQHQGRRGTAPLGPAGHAVFPTLDSCYRTEAVALGARRFPSPS